MIANAKQDWKPTDAEYYAATDWLSHSDFKHFLKSPKAYQRYVLDGIPFKRTSSMEFGSLVDAAVFHPDGFGRGIVTIPDEVLSGSGARHGHKWKEFAAANEGKILLKNGDNSLYNVLEALSDHAEAIGILEALGESQVAFRWESEVEGVALKRRAKLDKLPTGLPFIADLKTTADPSPASFASQIVSLGYHTQGVWYQDAVESKYGVRPPVLLVAAQNCEPFDVEVYELNAKFIELGRRRIDDNLPEFIACQKSGVWRKPTHNRIIEIAPPYWAERATNEWNFQGE